MSLSLNRSAVLMKIIVFRDAGLWATESEKVIYQVYGFFVHFVSKQVH